MTASITTGKLRGLMRLSAADGQFQMLAVDHRESLETALRSTFGEHPEFEELENLKALVLATLSALSSAVSIDTVYGSGSMLKLVPRSAGLLLACEHSGESSGGSRETSGVSTEVSGPSANAAATRLSLGGWSARRVARFGADALMLRITYHPGDARETSLQLREMVSRVGHACAEEDIAFLLEIGTGLVQSGSANRGQPEAVAAAAAEFSQPEYRVDLLSLEFPGDFKRSQEYSRGGILDAREREPAYTVAEIHGFCRAVNRSSAVPWVIHSGGVNIDEFLLNLEFASAAGASGFLCGRAIWQDAVKRCSYGLEDAEAFLTDVGVYNMARANAVSTRSLPWWSHRRWGGMENIHIVVSDGDSH